MTWICNWDKWCASLGNCGYTDVDDWMVLGITGTVTFIMFCFQMERCV